MPVSPVTSLPLTVRVRRWTSSPGVVVGEGAALDGAALDGAGVAPVTALATALGLASEVPALQPADERGEDEGGRRPGGAGWGAHGTSNA